MPLRSDLQQWQIEQAGAHYADQLYYDCLNRTRPSEQWRCLPLLSSGRRPQAIPSAPPDVPGSYPYRPDQPLTKKQDFWQWLTIGVLAILVLRS